jgi:hypothetical protein
MNIKYFSVNDLCFVEREINLNEIIYFGMLKNSDGEVGFLKLKSNETISCIASEYISEMEQKLQYIENHQIIKSNQVISIFFLKTKKSIDKE